jgi:hypothetical protein
LELNGFSCYNNDTVQEIINLIYSGTGYRGNIGGTFASCAQLEKITNS